MQCLKQLERLHRIHRLIQHESTGSAANLAAHLQISPRQLGAYIEVLKDMGAPITFCSVIKSYKYSSPVRFQFDLRLFVADKLVYSLD
ncbi:HTH domain-containing protein [Aquirufa rosea]|nr:HTH domain-containing protein [Aquirufa rosea]